MNQVDFTNSEASSEETLELKNLYKYDQIIYK